jgi:ectoine hydroxylase
MLPRQDPVVYGSTDEGIGPLKAKQIRHYERDGFLFFPKLFSPQEVLQFNQQVDQMIGQSSPESRPEFIQEPGNGEVRSIFAVHQMEGLFKRLAKDPRLVGPIRQILNSDVYIHQSRVNRKPAFAGKEFYWHSDFETWHQEDGMPRMRAISCSIFLSENTPHNGPTMVLPGSHEQFISCVGQTPERHYLKSLKKQEYGVPSQKFLSHWDQKRGIEAPIGPAGSVLFFECNLLHGSNSNITPRPRSNVFLVYNSIENALVDPYSGQAPRPEYIASRDFTPVEFL